MAAAWVAPAIEAAGSIATSATSGLFGMNQAKKNRAFQERMYYQQVKDNRENWERVAAYNLPSAQLQRLIDARMNPLLAYGENGMSSVLTSPAQGGSAPHGDKAVAQFQNPFAGLGSNIAIMRKLDSEVKNLDADSVKKTQEALESAARTIKTRVEADSAGLDYKWNYDTYYQRMEALQAQTNLNLAFSQTEASKRTQIEAEIKKLDQETDFLEHQVYNQDRMTDQQIKESDQRITNSIKETAAMVSKLNAEERKALADAYYSRAMGAIASDPKYKDAAIQKEVQAVKNMIIQGDTNELQKKLNEFKLKMLPTGDSWYDKAGYVWKKFVELTVGPIGDVLSSALGGIGAAATK